MRIIFTVLITTLLSIPLIYGASPIHPKPQDIKLLSTTNYTNIQYIIPQGDDLFIDAFCESLNSEISRKGVKLRIGTVQDKAGREYADKVKGVEGAYYIKIDQEIVVVGYDMRGVTYALSTLKQLLIEGNTLPHLEILDYPDIAYRGVVEGFYGEPWSHEDRISLINYFGKNRLNVYIYGPKNDEFHRTPNWREPYPAEMATKITELVKISKDNLVDFVWAIHPGQDITWNGQDREFIVKKFEMMYQLGVRSFALFFDDISGIGTEPVRQAELLNYLHDNFIAKKNDCTPLIMCPTQYNRAWSDPEPNTYLDILGEKLHPSIEVMWTGDSVVADITEEGINYINKRIKRKAYIWWNFPVSDYTKDHLMLGRSYGLDTNAVNLMSGFMSNPMDKAEASKVAIYSIGDYTWNIAKFDSEQEWYDAIKDIMPKSYEAYKTFSMHNSDSGQNVHGYRREESVNMVDCVDEFYTTRSMSNFNRLNDEFAKIERAPATIRKNNENPNLIDEISPWLDQFEMLGASGQLAISIYPTSSCETTSAVWSKLCSLFTIQEQQERLDKSYYRAHQPGIKSGSLVMQPFVDTLTTEIANNIYEKLTGNRIVGNNASPVIISNVPQIIATSVRQIESKTSISSIFESISIEPNQYFGIKFPTAIKECSVDINLYKYDVQDFFIGEVSVDGTTWSEIELQVKGHSCKFNTPKSGVSFVRLINKSDSTVQLHMRKFDVISPQSDGKNSDSLIALDGDLQTSFNLKSEVVIDNFKEEVKSIVLLVNSTEPIAIDIYAIDYKGGETKLDHINNVFSEINIQPSLQSKIKSFRLQTITPVTVHELIAK